MENMKVASLEQTALVQIIMLLQEKGETLQNEIIKGTRASQEPVYNALDTLVDLRLVVKRVQNRPFKKYFSLTEKGRRVAALLAEIEKVLLSSGLPEDH